ncbi:MAG: hypothetical protein RL410_1381, partial [Actinomycetota bacterium]
MTKLIEVVSRYGGALLTAYFGVAVLVNVTTKHQADFLAAVHLTGVGSAIVGAVLAIVSLLLTYLL